MLRLTTATAAARVLHRPVVTLGVFDGVHIGHRYVIEQVVRLARERHGTAVVVTFRDHPRAVIDGRPPQLITSLEHRLRLFADLGVDATLLLEFDDALRRTTAADFARGVFVDALHAEIVLLGFNHRFGQGGLGDLALLQAMAPAAGFTARQAEPITLGGSKVSSTEIRRLILAGDLERAAQMLGRPVSILGTVVRGDGRGRTLGFPTANLDLHHEVRPPRGVYGCELEVDAVRRPALCNIGIRPTFKRALGAAEASGTWESRDTEDCVEVHVLDFEGDLYGRDLEVVFLMRLRDERRFNGRDELVRQIGVDRRDFEARLR